MTTLIALFAIATQPPGAGGGLVKLAIMFIIDRWGVLYPPPSPWDTSRKLYRLRASAQPGVCRGGYEMTFFVIATQSGSGAGFETR